VRLISIASAFCVVISPHLWRSRAQSTAPVSVWSGSTIRHRVNPGGDRSLNLPLHRTRIAQLQQEGNGRMYLAKRIFNHG
jgi:hypothetical protein